MSITEFLNPIFDNEDLKRFKLQDKAVKILNRFIELPEQYISLNAARQNVRRTITSQDVFTIVTVLEQLGYLIGKLEKGRMVFKFNNGVQRTAIAVPLTQIEAAQARYQERLAKRVENAAKTIERYKNLGSLVDIVSDAKQKKEVDTETERQLVKGFAPQKEYVPTFLSVKTAKELHDAGECDKSKCRLCEVEKALKDDKEQGLGL